MSDTKYVFIVCLCVCVCVCVCVSVCVSVSVCPCPRLRKKHGNDWATIGAVLGRSASSVKDRCRLMKDTCNTGTHSLTLSLLSSPTGYGYTLGLFDYGKSLMEIIITIILVNFEITIIQTIISWFENKMHLFSISLQNKQFVTENLNCPLQKLHKMFK